MYRRSWNNEIGLDWDDGTRPSRFTPWPNVAFVVAVLWWTWGMASGLSAWVMIPGFFFALYLIDHWVTVMDTPKS